MLFTEWNLEDALKIEREEGYEEGYKEGYAEGRELARREIIGLLSEYLSVGEIARGLKMPVEDINHYLEKTDFQQMQATFSINQ